MKAWMKYLLLAVALSSLGCSWFWLGSGGAESLAHGFGSFVVWMVSFAVATLFTLAGICILYELADQWYQKKSGGVSWIYNTLNKFRAWLGKDGM